MHLSKIFIANALNWLHLDHSDLDWYGFGTAKDKAILKAHSICPAELQQDYFREQDNWNLTFLLLLLAEEGICL